MSKIKSNDVISSALCIKEKITWGDLEGYLSKKDDPGHEDSEIVTTDGEQSISNKIISDSTLYDETLDKRVKVSDILAQYHLHNYNATADPTSTDDSGKGYSLGSKWYNRNTGEWFICTKAAEGAIWQQLTLSTDDLGSAAKADIVNDLSTGGATDVLSAEQGKTLHTSKQDKPVEGAPVTPVAAKLVTGYGENWEITWEAVTKGDAGKAISIEIVNGTGESSPITISTTGNAISIALATDALGNPDNASNTATAVLTELNADETAGALVQGTLTGGGGICATEVSANLAGGVDGTAAQKGDMRYETDKLWIAVAECSITDISGWKYSSLS